MKTKLLLTTFQSSVRSVLRLVIVRLIFILSLSPVPSALSQIPQGFNYQAIARDGSGNPITNATIKVKLSILTDTTGFYATGSGTYIWEEEQTGVKTNAFGLFTVVFGNPSATKTLGIAASFSAIDWAKTPLYIGTKIANPTDYKNLGSAQLWSVPYAMVADSSKSLLKGSRLSVVSADDATSDALFEVKRKDGQTVFAVYPNAVNIYVPRTTPKGVKGGFAIGGFDGSKTDPQDYFRVTPDSVRIYIDKTPNLLKGATKGGFAIGGFDQVKGWRHDLFTVSKDSVRVYIDKTPSVKGATKGGFAIGGYDEGKGGGTQDLLTVSNDSIRMYINDVTGTGKGTTKGGFAIGGFDQLKGYKNFLNIDTKETGIINPAVNRIVWYPLKNAFLTGKVLVEKPDSVGVNSFASGYESKAIGNYSQALGFNSVARGDYSTSIGYRNLSSGPYSFTLGYRNTATGVNSNAFGIESVATGLNSFAMGYNARALGQYAFVMGFNSAAKGGPSFAFGDRCQALQWGSVAMGWLTKSDATHSMVIGDHTISKAQNLFVIGRANDTTVYHTDSWDGFYDEDPVFIIGNGWVYNNVAQTRSNAFTVLKSGKTGINMNYPAYYLDVKGRGRFMGIGSETAGFFLSKNDGTLRSFIGMMDDNYSGFYGSGGVGWSLVVHADNGNVGIGNTTPDQKLVVQGNIKVTDGSNTVSINTNSLQTWKNPLYLGNDGNHGLQYFLDFAGYSTIDGPALFGYTGGALGTNNNGTYGMNLYWKNNGDIYVPGIQTQIQGDGNNVVFLSWGTGGKLIRYKLLTTSSRRYKENITNLENIDWLFKLNPVNYSYISDETHQMKYGLIAEEVVNVNPKLVGYNEKNEVESVNYNLLITPLIKAVQEQNNKIETLSSENQQLKSELQLLKGRMEQIESTLAKSGVK